MTLPRPDASTEPSSSLELRSVSVRFGAVQALDDVSSSFAPGVVTALLGENGSGKSTLVKVLAGIYQPAAGSVLRLHGEEVPLPLTPVRAVDLGLKFLHQDLGLLEECTVAENIALQIGFGTAGLGWISESRLNLRARNVLAEVGVDVDPRRLVGELSMRDRTLVAFARMLAGVDPEHMTRQVLVLDEPTASLDPGDAAEIYSVVTRAARRGATVLLITHHLEEVVEHADEVRVLRAGRLVASRPTDGMTPADLARAMIGDDWSEPEAGTASPGPAGRVLLTATGVCASVLADVDLEVRAGEVVGVCGLRGAGPAELAGVLAGTIRPRAGRLQVAGTEITSGHPARSLAAGLTTVPEDRRGSGVHLEFSVLDNIALGARHRRGTAFAPLRRRRERGLVDGWVGRLDVRPASPSTIVGSMSGGNQQKVALARALQSAPRVLVLDEPTQGVDVGARRTIWTLVRDFVGGGAGVVLFSSNHEEILELCDRVVVLHRGRVHTVVDRAHLTRDQLLEAVGGSAASTIDTPSRRAS